MGLAQIIKLIVRTVVIAVLSAPQVPHAHRALVYAQILAGPNVMGLAQIIRMTI